MRRTLRNIGVVCDQRLTMNDHQQRGMAAQAAAAHAFARLLSLAEDRDRDQISYSSACFIASVFDGIAFPWNVFEMRLVDVGTSDDMLLCLAALRWGNADLHTLVPNGEQRAMRAIEDWGLVWPWPSTWI